MNKRLSLGAMTVLLTMVLGACGGKVASSVSSSSRAPSTSRSSRPSSSSQAPAKGVSDLNISLGNDGGKAYITVRGTQFGYTANDFKWAWGLKEQSGSTFADGKANPTAADFKEASFNSNNEFTVKYCLTDIEGIVAGTLYRIYGGTPESYGDIPFASNMFGANDGTRKYYLRQDKENSLVFESIQPFTYNEASVVEIAQDDLPDGITNAGAYLKFGGNNSKNYTIEDINSWHASNKIAGDFQRVILPSDSDESVYSQHVHTDSERFWKIEDNKVFFYLYCGFIKDGEGWMVHFDLVSGNQGAGLQTSTSLDGKTPYVINGATYRVYSDTNKGGEENYWGCLGVYRDIAQA